MSLIAVAKPGKGLLRPDDHTLIMIDFQSQMAFASHSIDMVALRSNAALIAEAVKAFGVARVITTVAARTFSGPIFDEIKDVLPDETILDRTSMNAWEDSAVIDRLNTIGNDRIVLCGLWTSVCIVGPAVSAIEQGYEVYVVADACADITPEAHDRAMERMIQLGARPMTSLQYLLELQRDWARMTTYDQTTGIARRLGGGYGLGIAYARTMLSGH
jgi:nicotinamidase-related amidase